MHYANSVHQEIANCNARWEAWLFLRELQHRSVWEFLRRFAGQQERLMGRMAQVVRCNYSHSRQLSPDQISPWGNLAKTTKVEFTRLPANSRDKWSALIDECWTGLGALALIWCYVIWFSWLFFDECRPVPIALRHERAPSRLPAGSALQKGPAEDATIFRREPEGDGIGRQGGEAEKGREEPVALAAKRPTLMMS